MIESINSSSGGFPNSHASIKGLQDARKQFESAAARIAENPFSVENTVEMISGQRAFEANAVALKTADQMVGTLLNTYA